MFDIFDECEPARVSRPGSSSCPPGPVLAGLLTDGEGAELPDPGAVWDVVGRERQRAAMFVAVEHGGSWERLQGWCQAQQMWHTHALVTHALAVADACTGGPDGAVAGLSAGEIAMTSLSAQCALAWRVAGRTATRRINESVSLVEGVPPAVEALADGRISMAHLRALADVLLDVDDPELRRRLCEELLPEPDDAADAPEGAARRGLRTPGDLKRAARRSVARRAPGAARTRAARARRQRGVFLQDEPDGMASVVAYLPAEEALAIYRTVDAHARRTHPDAPADAAPGPEPSRAARTADNERADALGDLVFGGALLAAGVIPDDDEADHDDAGVDHIGDEPDADAESPERPAATGGGTRCGTRAERTRRSARGGSRRSKAERRADRRRHRDREGRDQRRPRMPRPPTTNVQVRVVIGADTLLGLDDMPGELIGYGPITADHARALAIRNDATWRRLVTDPVSGAVLDVGHRRYRPPAALADLVGADHPTCSFPGCRMPVEACDLDHVVPFDPADPAGVTSEGNLRPGCRRHHVLKTLGGWRVETHGDGGVTWTSPSGHRYRTRREPFLPARPCSCPEAAEAPGEQETVVDRPVTV